MQIKASTYNFNKGKLKVAYIEKDTPTAVSFIKTFGMKLSIVAFEDNSAGLKWMRKGNQPDLVIVNEESDGFELLEKIKSSPFLKDLPVLIVTQHLTEEKKRKAFQMRALDIFSVNYANRNLDIVFDYLQRKKAYSCSKAASDTPTQNLPEVRIPLWKRSIDLAVAGSALVALSPLLGVVSLLIYIDSPGPVFYYSKRVGAGYRVFDMYKFRSMKIGADKEIASLASKNIYENQVVAKAEENTRCNECRLAGIDCKNPLFVEGKSVCEQEYILTKQGKATFMKFREDPRITRLGQFLRNSSIDELPQLFNILRGDMSLVGNRPLPLYEAEKLTTTDYIKRFAGPAGLTGLWQVMKRAKGQTRMSDRERILLDVKYAETFSLKIDIDIILKTLTAVWQKENV